MTLNNEEKRQIMNELAQGKPGVIYQEPTSNPSQDEQFEVEYQNFNDLAQRSGQDVRLESTEGNLLEQIREQIKAELQQAKATGQLRSGRIREIVQSAMSQVRTEVKAGSSDIRQVFKDTMYIVLKV